MSVAIAAAVVVAVAAAACVLLPRLLGHEAAELKGAWQYENEATYVFDGKRRGYLLVNDTQYDFSYKASGEKLKLNYDDEHAQDGTYRFSVKEDQLTLEGGKGTAGGSYQLVRVNAGD